MASSILLRSARRNPTEYACSPVQRDLERQWTPRPARYLCNGHSFFQVSSLAHHTTQGPLRARALVVEIEIALAEEEVALGAIEADRANPRVRAQLMLSPHQLTLLAALPDTRARLGSVVLVSVVPLMLLQAVLLAAASPCFVVTGFFLWPWRTLKTARTLLVHEKRNEKVEPKKINPYSRAARTRGAAAGARTVL